jgi:hypothetical protein
MDLKTSELADDLSRLPRPAQITAPEEIAPCVLELFPD